MLSRGCVTAMKSWNLWWLPKVMLLLVKEFLKMWLQEVCTERCNQTSYPALKSNFNISSEPQPLTVYSSHEKICPVNIYSVNSNSMQMSLLLLVIYTNKLLVVPASYLPWNYLGIISLCVFQVSLTVEGLHVWLELKVATPLTAVWQHWGCTMTWVFVTWL